MNGNKLIEKLHTSLQKKEIDAPYVQRLIQQLEARETMRQWVSLGVMTLLVVGLGVGAVFSLGEAVLGA